MSEQKEFYHFLPIVSEERFKKYFHSKLTKEAYEKAVDLFKFCGKYVSYDFVAVLSCAIRKGKVIDFFDSLVKGKDTFRNLYGEGWRLRSTYIVVMNWRNILGIFLRDSLLELAKNDDKWVTYDEVEFERIFHSRFTPEVYQKALGLFKKYGSYVAYDFVNILMDSIREGKFNDIFEKLEEYYSQKLSNFGVINFSDLSCGSVEKLTAIADTHKFIYEVYQCVLGFK